MTDHQRLATRTMRREGNSYSQIATALCLSENTVKSFCRRNGLKTEISTTQAILKKENANACRHCGKGLSQVPKQKPKKFCSDRCRFGWWAIHKEDLKTKDAHARQCLFCGETFYGNTNRKFCSHPCYIRSRFGKVGDGYDSRAV